MSSASSTRSISPTTAAGQFGEVELPGMVENAVGSVQGVGPVKVNVTFDPPWDQSRMSEEARLALNLW